MAAVDRPLHVTILALPDVMVSTLSGIYEVLTSFGVLAGFDATLPARPPFTVELAKPDDAPVETSTRLQIGRPRPVAEIARTDIVIVPSVIVEGGRWQAGRFPAAVDWLKRMHAQGATLCSACSGVLLLAETGLLDGHRATLHWSYLPTFRDNYPAIALDPLQVLLLAGERDEFVLSGASASWHDLVLYLIVRHVGPTAAQSIARFFALQWHPEGLAPYVMFAPPTGHGDAAVRTAQDWVASHFSVANPVEQMARQAGLGERSFKRRFRAATGHAPLDYVQRLRVEEAKRRLERTTESVDDVSWRVGYEDPAYFRRLFRRLTGDTPAAYRRRFRVPDIPRAEGDGMAA